MVECIGGEADIDDFVAGARAAAPIGSATYVQNWIVHIEKIGGQSEYVTIVPTGSRNSLLQTK